MPTYTVRIVSTEPLDGFDIANIENVIFAAGIEMSGPGEGRARYSATVDPAPVAEVTE